MASALVPLPEARMAIRASCMAQKKRILSRAQNAASDECHADDSQHENILAEGADPGELLFRVRPQQPDRQQQYRDKQEQREIIQGQLRVQPVEYEHRSEERRVGNECRFWSLTCDDLRNVGSCLVMS